MKRFVCITLQYPAMYRIKMRILRLNDIRNIYKAWGVQPPFSLFKGETVESRKWVQTCAIHWRPWKSREKREFHPVLCWQTILSRGAFGTLGALPVSRRNPADIQVRGRGSQTATRGRTHDGAHCDANAVPRKNHKGTSINDNLSHVFPHTYSYITIL